MLNEKNLSRFIVLAPMLVIAVVALCALLLLVGENYQRFQDNMAKSRDNLIKKIKSDFTTEINELYYYIEFKKLNEEKKLRNSLEEDVGRLYNLVDKFYKEDRNTRKQQAIKRIRNCVRHMTLENSDGYFFIMDMDGNIIESPMLFDKVISKKAANSLSSESRLIYNSILRKIKRSGKGHLDYNWKNNETGLLETKLVYTRHFHNLNWIIGKTESLRNVESVEKQNVIDRIENLYSFKKDNIALIDIDGKVLFHPLIPMGENFIEHLDPKYTNIDSLLIEEQNDGYLNYDLRIQDDRFRYTSIFSLIEDWGWYLIKSFTSQDIDAQVAKLKRTKEYEYKKNILIVLSFAGIIFGVMLVVSWFMAKISNNIFNKYKKHIQDKETNLLQINNSLNRYLNIIDENVITLTLDRNGFVTNISSAFVKSLGFTKNEMIYQYSEFVVNSPYLPDEFFQSIRQSMSTSGEFRCISKSGNSFCAFVHLIFQKESNDFLMIMEDITDKKKVEELSIKDGLTDVYNRRHFNDVFQRELKRIKREQNYLTFVILDIDHFKQYNDIYGHLQGDRTLKTVSNALAKRMQRPTDYVFRMGGEEFCLLFCDQDEEASVKFCDLIRQDIENLQIEHCKNSASKYITISLGVFTITPEVSKHLDEDEIYQKADEALYKAKQSGRNKTVVLTY